MSLHAREGTEWVSAEPSQGWFTDAPVGDSQVVWARMADTWRQTWPEPDYPQTIEVDWIDQGGSSAIASLSWSRAVDPEHQNPRTAGDLVVRYTVTVYANSGPNQNAPIDTSDRDWETVETVTVPAAAVTSPVLDDPKWTLPTPLVLSNLTAYCVEVTAHYDRHDGTAPVPQVPPVTRTSFIKGLAPVSPLAAPPVTLEWITDAGISKGTKTGVGNFRFAETKTAMNFVVGRDPVPPVAVFDFAALGNQPAASGLPNEWRPVEVDISFPAVTAARPPIPPQETIVFDFPASGTSSAVSGARNNIRRTIETGTDPQAGDMYVGTPATEETVGWTGFDASVEMQTVHVRFDLVKPPPPVTSHEIVGPWIGLPAPTAPAKDVSGEYGTTFGQPTNEVDNLAALKADPVLGDAVAAGVVVMNPDEFIVLRDGSRARFDGTTWTTWTQPPAPPVPETDLATLRADSRVGSLAYKNPPWLPADWARLTDGTQVTWNGIDWVQWVEVPPPVAPGENDLISSGRAIRIVSGDPSVNGRLLTVDPAHPEWLELDIPVHQFGGTFMFHLDGPGWATKADPTALPHVTATATLTFRRAVDQVGTARTVTLPWNGTPGTPGDPGAAAGTAAQTVKVTIPQYGTRRELPWDGVIGSAGDPGQAPVRIDTSTWSWPFNATIVAVPNADAYEILTPAGWTDIPVPAAMIGPAATGTFTLADQWQGVMPGSDIELRVRAVQRTAGAAPEPGIVGKAVDTVPEFPTIPPVGSLKVRDAGWKHVQVDWTMPALPAGAEHYFSGKWAVVSNVAARQTTSTTTATVEAPDVPIPANGPFEATVAANPTPAGNYTRLRTPYPVDPGPPPLDAPRNAEVDVLPITGWQMDGPSTWVVGTLPARFVQWIQRAADPSALVSPISRRDPDKLQWPAIRGGPSIGIGFNDATHQWGNYALPLTILSSSGVWNPQQLLIRPGPGQFVQQLNSNIAKGAAGASVDYGLPTIADGSKIVGLRFLNPHIYPGPVQASFYDNNTKRWITTGPQTGLGLVPGWVSTSAPNKYDASGWNQDPHTLDIRRLRIATPGVPFYSYGAGFATFVQPPPKRIVGALHSTPGTFLPRTIRYRPVESRP